MVDMLCKTDMKSIFDEYLDNYPNSAHLEENDFIPLIFELVDSANIKTLLKNKDKLTATPIREWSKVIADIAATNPVTLTSDHSISHWMESLHRLEGRINTVQWASQIHAEDKVIKNVFDRVDVQPTNLQQAIAIYQIGLMAKKRRQYWVIPGGVGKSFIAATLALHALMNTNINIIHFIIPEETLMQREQTIFSQWWECCGDAHRIRYHLNLDFVSEENDLIVIDEADYLMCNDPIKFFCRLEKEQVICLTATQDDLNLSQLEDEVMQFHDFTKIDFWPKCMERPLKTEVDKKLKFQYAEELCEHLRGELKSNPVLVFGNDAVETEFKEAGLHPICVDGFKDFQRLKKLNIKENGELYDLLVAKQEVTMRGTDFRCTNVGITLIVMKSFSSFRAAQQGLNRVGRFGDKCCRYIIDGVQLVNDISDRN